MLSLVLSLPYSHSANFWDTILIFAFWVQTAVFMVRACSGSHPPLNSRIWKRSSAIRFFPRCAGLLSKSKITQDLINPASAGENLARYIIRASFSFTQNFPNPVIRTSSPDSSVLLMISSKDSVTLEASDFFKPVFMHNASIIQSFVRVILSILSLFLPGFSYRVTSFD